MIIFVNNWKKKLLRVAVALAIIAVFVCTLPMLTGLLSSQEVPAGGRWLQEEHPSGNPMRVEQSQGTKFENMLDQFVIKVQDFYYEE